VLADSARALIMLAAADGSLDHDGMSPQHISDDSRMGSLGFWRMTGTGWVGAMLYRAGLVPRGPVFSIRGSVEPDTQRDSIPESASE